MLNPPIVTEVFFKRGGVMSMDEQDFHDAVLADDLVRTPSEYVREQRAKHEDRLEAAELLEGLRALDAGGDGIRWSISRVGHSNPDLNGHMVTWATSQLDADQIRDTLGAGKYYVKGRRSNGEYGGHKVITIASDAPRREGASTVLPAVNALASGTPTMTEFLSAQERRDRERQERDDRRSEKREQLILASLPAVATVLAAMFNRPQIDLGGLAAALKPAPAPDPLVMIAALKQLAPEQPKGPAPMETAIQLFELLADKAGDSGKTQMLDVVKEGVKILGPTVGSAIEGAIASARLNAQHAAAQPVPGMSVAVNGETPPIPSPALPSSPASAASSGESSMLDLLPHRAWLREQLGRCVVAAEKERNPQLYAEVFLEELPPGLKPERMLELLAAVDWYQTLCQFDSRIAQQGSWWAAMREQLVQYLQESLQPVAERKRAASVEVDRPTGLPSLTGD